jgi:hypothetical protein
MSTSKDPLLVPYDKLLELIRGLGLNPVEPADIQRITIDGDGVEIVRYRRTAKGALLLGFGDRPLTETVTIGFDR